MTIPLTLREARAGRQMTQRQLAEAAGLSRVTVSNIERGRTRPSPRAARRVSQALGLPPLAIAEFLPLADEFDLRPPTFSAADNRPDLVVLLDGMGTPAVAVTEHRRRAGAHLAAVERLLAWRAVRSG